MRYIGSFTQDNLAHRFSLFLKKEGIENSLEMQEDTPSSGFCIWVHDEDDITKAMHLFEDFQKEPQNPKFDVSLAEIASPIQENILMQEDLAEEGQNPKSQETLQDVATKTSYPFKLTAFFLGLCIAVFIMNLFQSFVPAEKKSNGKNSAIFTPIQEVMLYDMPAILVDFNNILQNYAIDPNKPLSEQPLEVQEEFKKLETKPFWRGFSEMLIIKYKHPNAPKDSYTGMMFEKLRQGQVWRLISPAFLHTAFLHILFNMIWLWLLGRQIEIRLKTWRYLLLVVIVAIVSNTAQYLMSGPLFLGYSGVIMGMAGFIWMRQKVAPWEGYPLPRSTIIFLAFFVIAMFFLEFFSFGLQIAGVYEFAPKIANTAHIVGALTGIVLARCPYFNWRKS